MATTIARACGWPRPLSLFEGALFRFSPRWRIGPLPLANASGSLLVSDCMTDLRDDLLTSFVDSSNFRPAMKNLLPRPRLLLLCFLALPALSIQAESPVSQVVVLHNGGVIMGVVKRTEDRYIVSKGPWHVVRVPLRDADFVARDMIEAYQVKRTRLSAQDFHEHVRLAQWCLRHDLDRSAGDLLLHLAKLDPYHAAIQSLEKQLQRRADVRSGAVPKIRTASYQKSRSTHEPATVDVGDLPPLPTGAMASFTRIVQPLVLNRCGQSTCHGHASKNQFRLTKTGLKRQIKTWHNLRAVLSQIDPQHVDSSPLLIKATAAHGSSPRPPLGPRERQKFNRLVRWVSQVAGDGSPLEIANLDTRTTDSKSPRSPWSASNRSGVEAEAVASQTSPPAAADPFDPNRFNEQLDTSDRDAESGP